MNNTRKKAANFVVQGSILAMAGILVRIIGMLYRMPLNDIIGKQGNGYYTSAYNVYNILLILSSYSMPVAVSKMISTRLARGEYKNCTRILRAGLVYATVAGGAAAAILWFGADTFAELIRTPFSSYALKTLAPTIWIMAYLGVLRGYFQGMGTMVPTAVSQILEQVVNAIVSVVAAGLLFDRGAAVNAATGAREYSYAFGAAGGTIGTGAGALTALIFFMILTSVKGRESALAASGTVSAEGGGRKESYGRLMHILTITIVPIVVSSAVYNCSNVVDNYLFGQGMDRLGFGADEIAIFWGALGQYQILFNIPVAVSNALSSSLVPSLSRAVSAGNREQTLERIRTAVRFSMLIAIPAAVGITVLAEPVCNLLFVSEDNTMLIRLSMAGSLAVVFYSLSTVTNAVLQGLNRMDVPVRHAAASLVIHVAVLEVFLMGLQWGIYSVVYANIIFALSMCILNARTIARHTGYRQEYKKTFLLPAVCAALMGAAAWLVYRGAALLLPWAAEGGRLGRAVLVLPSICAAVAAYAVLLVKLHAVDEAELKEMPAGMRLVRALKKVRVL